MQLVVSDPAERARIETELPRRLYADIERQGAVPLAVRRDFVEAIERGARQMGKISVVGHRRHRLVPAEVE